MVDENIQDGFSTVIYSPGLEAAAEDRESWYINMGIVTDRFLQSKYRQGDYQVRLLTL
jgi:hypothetical protein